MKDRLAALSTEALARIAAAEDAAALEQVEQTLLGRKGELSTLMRGIGGLPPEERGPFGQAVNATKQALGEALEERRSGFAAVALEAELGDVRFDPTEPAPATARGHLHPITLIRREVEQIFLGLGFDIEDGPEVESEAYNFDMLNIPAHHPARDMQDTFWLESGQVLRTHTSCVQLRAMQKREGQLPIRVIAPGRVFRNESQDATHEHTFHQVEGLMIDRGVSVADMKGVLAMFLSRLFGAAVDIRLRPSYFPFVEPGFELDMRRADDPDGEWIELMGCGLVHPHVLRAGGVDPDEASGFAFGIGLDRVVMMRYGIDDIRWMMSGDPRFLRQF